MSTDEARKALIARNETSWRQVNSRIASVAERALYPEEHMTFVCECGRNDCSQPVHLNANEYSHVRSDPKWFFVVPGHELLEAERVLESYDEFLIVEKVGPETIIAIENMAEDDE